MTHTFDLRRGLVIVPAFVAGPRGRDTFQFAVDTGASVSAVSGLLLEALGYHREQTTGRVHARTGSGGVTTGMIRVRQFAAFGIVRPDFPLLWLPLPPASRIDGLLGLDFCRGLVLTLDFARGRAGLRPRRWWRFWD